MKSLLDLLPKGGSSIVDTLQNELKFFRRFLFLIQEAEEGISHFLKGNLSHFDPHVGETACQIRAYYFALLWRKREEVAPSLERDLTQLKKYAENLMILLEQVSQNLHRECRPCALSVFLDKLNLNLKISETGWVLIIAHLLSKYRLIDQEGISETIDLLKLQRCMNESRIFTRELVNYLQVKLSALSVNWVINWAEDLPKNSDIVTTPEVLKKLLREGDDHRLCLPSFGTLDVILKHIRYVSQVPIFFALTVLTASSQYLNCKWIQVVNQEYVFSDSVLNISEASSAFVARAVSLNMTEILNENYFNVVVDKIEKNGIEKSFLWVNADHPQYSGRKLRYFAEHPVEKGSLEEDVLRYQLFYEQSKKEGRNAGVGLSNPSFFYLKHFCTEGASLFQKREDYDPFFLWRFFEKTLIPCEVF
jgi:hypothetical protein